MQHSNDSEATRQQTTKHRRAMIKQWAAYVRTHDDRDWSRQQNRLIDSQIQTANAMADSGATDPVRFSVVRDQLTDR